MSKGPVMEYIREHCVNCICNRENVMHYRIKYLGKSHISKDIPCGYCAARSPEPLKLQQRSHGLVLIGVKRWQAQAYRPSPCLLSLKWLMKPSLLFCKALKCSCELTAGHRFDQKLV